MTPAKLLQQRIDRLNQEEGRGGSAMLVYLPYYDRGFKVLCVDARKAKYHHTPGYSAVIEYQSMWYNGDNIFKTYDAAAAWIQRDYKACMPFMINWEVQGNETI